MQAVVLAAGKGTRLRPLTDEKPKALVEVADTPILTRCFETVVELDADELVVVIGYEGEKIRERYGDSFSGVPITYVRQDEQLGMAHALLQAEPHVEGSFMCIDGDCIIQSDLRPLVERQREDGVDAVQEVEFVSTAEARVKAICEVNEENELLGIEKEPENPPNPSLVAAGFAVYDSGIFDACSKTELSVRGEYELAEAIQRFVSEKTMLAMTTNGWSVNVNTPEERKIAEQRLRNST
ncbi:glucose-1-phosphate thymidylyltransferase [Haladaptatus litoreus]|uniref:Glucose-1-phosphate thymidylyltransferase n=1 Tax=Haladaptatus litoreus TaxID=553468 RepID=A0A1N6UQ40_9EURY|nr:sugar phosphate nucleotidyltransferase [Haladaptatus litoreus]SIQ67765.1 glucose-1-phosphate thymidylyltransferase [Haladaptatus litoreus]